ncbi:MAG: aminotransferase class I/II-fold pyridoxal phosphate-dependent enzyme [Bacteroidota bacterium]
MIIAAADRISHVKTYYFAQKLGEIRQRNAQGANIINLGIGNPDLMPAEDTIKSLINAAVEPGNHGYQPYKGIPQLRKAFSDWYAAIYGVTLDPGSELLPLIGSKEGIMHISTAFLNPGDEVLVPNPGYPAYASAARIAGAEVKYYELHGETDWQPDLESLAKQDLSRVKIMWLNYPHMPTGALAQKETFEKLVAFAQKHQILLCHDNPYSLILNPNPLSILSIPGAEEVAMELNSLSKSHNMAGWRVGVLAGAEDYIQTVLKVKSNMDSGMFLPIQQAAITALGMSFQWHQAQNEIYAKRRNFAFQLMDLLECTYEKNRGGMFVWGRIPERAESGQVYSEWILNQARVFIAPGFIFGSQGNRYIRLSLCANERTYEEAIQRVKMLSVPQV